MKRSAFAPGFRLSVADVFVLFGGTISAIVLSMYVWWWGFIPAFVLAHFFLFCNIARPLELIWAGVFVPLAGTTISFEMLGWLVTVLFVVRDSYFGRRQDAKVIVSWRGLAVDQSRPTRVAGSECWREGWRLKSRCSRPGPHYCFSRHHGSAEDGTARRRYV